MIAYLLPGSHRFIRLWFLFVWRGERCQAPGWLGQKEARAVLGVQQRADAATDENMLAMEISSWLGRSKLSRPVVSREARAICEVKRINGCIAGWCKKGRRGFSSGRHASPSLSSFFFVSHERRCRHRGNWLGTQQLSRRNGESAHGLRGCHRRGVPQLQSRCTFHCFHWRILNPPSLWRKVDSFPILWN